MKYYYEANADKTGQFVWKVYHYDPTGNKEMVVATKGGFDDKNKALDAASEWMEDNNIDAELMY